MVFGLGTALVDPATGKMVVGPLQAQVARCLANIAAVLEEVGSSLAQAVSAALIVADDEDFAPANEEWLKWFPSEPPARPGAKMPVRAPGMKVSIAMIAEAGGDLGLPQTALAEAAPRTWV